MRIHSILLTALIIVSFSLTGVVYADYGKGLSKYSAHKDQTLDEKFYKKIMMIYKNQDELELSDKQMAKIKQIKLDTKKQLIMKQAEIDVLSIDIKSGLYDKKINTRALHGLIDKKYNIKRDKAKLLVSAIADLKNTLTDKQMDKLKDLYKACEKSKKSKTRKTTEKYKSHGKGKRGN